MIYLVFYDITDNTIRRKIADRLIRQGYERLQFSVFVGNRNLQTQKPLWNTLKTWVEEDNGKLAILSISATTLRKMRMLGEHAVDMDYILGKKFSMFI